MVYHFDYQEVDGLVNIQKPRLLGEDQDVLVPPILTLQLGIINPKVEKQLQMLGEF